jgi:hypothetical protein
MIKRIRSWFDDERDSALLGLMRVVFAGLLLHSAYKLANNSLGRGYFGDYFHVPFVGAAWVPGEAVYFALLALQGGAALLALTGVLARPALLASACVGLYLLTLDRLQYHNNRYLLLLLAFLLAFAPCDRAYTPFASRQTRTQRLGPVWARILIQIQVSLVYLASGGSKLLDADWRGGQVLSIRYQQGLEMAARQGLELPEWIRALLAAPRFGELSSKAAIATELFLAVALWLPKTRAVALWIGVMFHLGIEIGARVEIFSYLMWGALIAFCVPELGGRQIVFASDTRLGRWVERAIPRLDWLGRFELAPTTEQALPSRLEVVDRDGRRERGLGALALLARGICLFFPLWLPLRAAALLTSPRARDLSPRLGADRAAP